MIKLQNYTPEIYYKQSRDFQLLGRLFDVVLNYVKTNADMIYDIPSSDSAGSKMIDLLALSLGFNAKHNYSVKQLAALCSVLSSVLHNKGSQQAIELASTAILNAEGIEDPVLVYKDLTDIYNIILYIPQKLSDVTLLQDLLDYILPAGMTCDIIRSTQTRVNSTTELQSIDTVNVYKPTAAYDYFAISSVAQMNFNDDKFLNPNDKNKPGFFTNSTIAYPDIVIQNTSNNITANTDKDNNSGGTK